MTFILARDIPILDFNPETPNLMAGPNKLAYYFDSVHSLSAYLHFSPNPLYLR